MQRVSHLLGRRLEWLRQTHGLSLRSMSARLDEAGFGLHHTAVGKIERGERRVDLDELLAMSYVLDAAPVHLFVGADEPFSREADQAAEVVAGVAPSLTALRMWIRGDLPLAGQDPRRYRAFVPLGEHADKFRGFGEEVAMLGRQLQRAIEDADAGSISQTLGHLELVLSRAKAKFLMPEQYLTVEEGD